MPEPLGNVKYIVFVYEDGTEEHFNVMYYFLLRAALIDFITMKDNIFLN